MPRSPLLVLIVALAGCPTATEPPDSTPADDPTDGPRVLLDWAGPGFYDAPFPSEHRRAADGTIEIDGFPVIEPVLPFVAALIDLVDARLDGFGTTSGVFFRLAQDPGPLPSLAQSVGVASPLLLVGVDPARPDHGVAIPFTSDYRRDSGPYGAVRQLSLLPLQGRPLHPGTTYAAVILRDLGTATGERLGMHPDLATLRDGGAPEGMGAEAAARYRAGLAELAALGLPTESIAGLAVFTTHDPTAELVRAAGAIRADAASQIAPLTPFALTDVYDGYCVYRAEVEVPAFQQGAPPFSGVGGAWAIGADGVPELQGWERARVDVTVPRVPSPAGGFPTVLYVRTGGGADRALIDRGVRDATGASIPGTGPAAQLAEVGWAGIEIDGPHGGLRNVSESDEQFLMFNMTNPVAMRDNVRQSALELSLMPAFAGSIELDTSGCAGASPSAALDSTAMVLIGHSMGATIGPLALAITPELSAGVLSGAGGSWIANVVHKESPLPVRAVADSIVGYTTSGRTLHAHDPLLSLLQWGGESADPPVYGRLIGRGSTSPRDLLMVQGIVDTYILPPMANALSLALGLDRGGAARDSADPRLDGFAPWDEVAALAERPGAPITLPAAANLGDRTGVLVQYDEDPIEDGHEVFFQLDEPKRLLRCFLASIADGAPTVVGADAQCP